MKNKSLTLPVFLEFVELKTKVASIFPMFLGFLWSSYAYGQIRWIPTLVFIVAVLAFDMCTTAINNTMDFKKAIDLSYKENENVIGKNGLDLGQMVQIIFALLGIAVVFSLVLVWLTDLLLLPIGILCFLIGIFYTFGPLPLSRLPLGEIFSGVTMGFGIFFLAVYIQNPSDFLVSSWTSAGAVTIFFHWLETIKVFFMSLPLVCLIANIMLANNLCDYEQDLRNHRYTLVHYLQPSGGVKLYAFLSFLPWLLWIAYGLFGFLPFWALFGLIGLFPFIKNYLVFSKRQVKRETFICSIKNFVLFSGIYLLVLVVALF